MSKGWYLVPRHQPSPETSPFAFTVAQRARVDKTGDKMVDRKAMGDKTGGKRGTRTRSGYYAILSRQWRDFSQNINRLSSFSETIDTALLHPFG